jgi:hypothetical protein
VGFRSAVGSRSGSEGKEKSSWSSERIEGVYVGGCRCGMGIGSGTGWGKCWASGEKGVRSVYVT